MLTDAGVRNAKPGKKHQKLTDGGGLYLHVTPAGAKAWRLRYERGGKEQVMTIGRYPDITLADARSIRDSAKVALRAGRDPVEARKEAKAVEGAAAANTFEVIAREWHAERAPGWSKKHAEQVLDSLVNEIFPKFGSHAIDSITPEMVFSVLRDIEDRGAVETAHRIRQRVSAVFVLAIATGRGSGDPAAIVKPALRSVKKRRHPAVVTLDGIRKVLKDVEAVPAHIGTRLAMRLIALTAVRSTELRAAHIDEFEGLATDNPVWRIPALRMKGKIEEKREHLVPLSRQSVEVVLLARTLIGRGKLLFPGSRHSHRPISENALGYLLNRAGYFGRHVTHGFRSAFSTIMNEHQREDRDVIDQMLAHVPKDPVEGAYNRAIHIEVRRHVAQAWADLLLEGAAPLAGIRDLPQR